MLSCVCSPRGVAWPEAALAAGATSRLPSAHGARSVPGAAPSPGCFISHQALPDHPNSSQRIPQQNKLLITKKPGKAKPWQTPQLKQAASAVVSFPISLTPVSRKYPGNLTWRARETAERKVPPEGGESSVIWLQLRTFYSNTREKSLQGPQLAWVIQPGCQHELMQNLCATSSLQEVCHPQMTS